MEVKEPHAVSLKVLRLSRPSFWQQQPLPQSAILDPRAALAIPSSSIDTSFALTPTVHPEMLTESAFKLTVPQLTLPLAFGSAYVGEAFDCTLCVNNELSEQADRKITSIKLVAEMQTPSQTSPLELTPDNEVAAKTGLEYGDSIQTLAHYDLREEGSHTLVVSVSYNENIQSREASAISGGRIRSFRKLYQFPVGPCLSVRTKASELSSAIGTGTAALERYALEAQLENLADGPITIEKLFFESREPFNASSINWDTHQHLDQPMMAPREVIQVAFLIDERHPKLKSTKKEMTRDGRTILGLLTIHWRSELGQAGVLSTGWLTTRRK